MLFRFLKTPHLKERGITGIETAIIMIACVAVAAVFVITALSAGLFSTQKSQEAANSAQAHLQSTLSVRGEVLAYRGDSNISDSIGKIYFALTNCLIDGEAVDLTPPYRLNGGTGALEPSGLNSTTTITYIDDNVTAAQVPWTLTWGHAHTDDYMLSEQDEALITVWLHPYNGVAWSAGGNPPFLGDNYLSTRRKFTLVINQYNGAGLQIQRTTPVYLDPTTNLH
jgi:archaellin